MPSGMKKMLLLLTIILIPTYLLCQSGDGKSVSTAYYGTISTSQTWTYAYNGGVIYVGQSGNPDLTITTGGSLTIDAGVMVIFCSTASDLIITGTGVITADGTPSSKITFTRDYPTINYWGHISFQSMGSAGASLFDNCVIEYGDVRGNTGAASYGGGIYADFSSLTISSCIIQHNKALWGGGIFVSASRNPSIKACYLYDNLSNEGGGGIYLWNFASSIIENCIFDSNHCNGTTFSYYTGGGLASQSNGSIKVINCTFINNTSSRTLGQSIMLYGSVSNLIINSIVWGNTSNHFLLTGTNSVQYCGVQGSIPSGTGNFVLNSSNTGVNPMGPYFNDPSGFDWTIKYISPCRDAGTTPSPTVPSDYAGNSRIGTYDIGAYEVQYSRWKTSAGSTDWSTAANWDGGVPTSTRDIVIPAGATNYPTGTSPVDVTVGSNKYFIMEPGSKATVDDLTNSGTLRLESDATAISSLILNSFSGNPANVELFLTGGVATGTGPKWHYISSPFVSLDTTVISATTRNLVRYIEPMASPTTEAGWVNLRGYIYYSATSNPALGFGTLESGKGYNHYYSQNHEYTLSGALKTSDVVVTLEYTSDVAPNRYGFNLIGNPFSSGLDWDAISSDVNYPALTSKALHYTRDNQHVYYNNGIGSDETVTGIVPPMQGFFVKTYNTSTSPKPSITLAASARTNSSIPARYKKSNESISHLRLKISDGTNGDNMVIRLDNSAKTELDYDFDAIKYSISSTFPSIYTHAGTTKLAINGLPFPEENMEMVIPVEIKIITNGSYSITATTIANLEDYKVRLRDLSNGTVVDLKEISTFNFNSDPGTITGRFEILISKAITNDETLLAEEGPFKIYTNYGSIIIEPQSDLWENKTGSIVVTDFSGRSIRYIRQSEFLKGTPILVNEPDAEGLYIIDIQSGNLRYSRKIVIR